MLSLSASLNTNQKNWMFFYSEPGKLNFNRFKLCSLSPQNLIQEVSLMTRNKTVHRLHVTCWKVPTLALNSWKTYQERHWSIVIALKQSDSNLSENTTVYTVKESTAITKQSEGHIDSFLCCVLCGQTIDKQYYSIIFHHLWDAVWCKRLHLQIWKIHHD